MIPRDVLDRPEFKQVAAAFNEWMREYIDEPEKFEPQARTILDFIGSDIHGETPDYGTVCALTLLRYMDRTALIESDDATSPPEALGILILETA